MKKLKVMTIIGTRPEIIRLSEIIKKCDIYFDHILVHTGQNWDYSLNKVFFEDLGLREPDYYLDSVGGSLGETMGNIIAKSYDLIHSEKPDALLILGDTNSALSAISAKRLKTPIFHMEAGNRCFDENLPEEINRKIVDHISDINLPYTEHARRYLLSEGIRKEHIYVTGSPMAEVINKYRDQINNSDVLNQLKLEKEKYILVSAHREENIDNEKNFLFLMTAINQIAENYNMPVVYSTHPRSKKFINEREFVFHPLVRSLQPFGFFDSLKFPSVSLRTSTERPEAFDKGGVILGGINTEDILQAVELSRLMWENGDTGIDVPAYVDENVSVKVIKIIQSYTKIVNKVIWNK